MLDLVAQVKHKGTSFKAIEGALDNINWETILVPQSFVISVVKGLLEKEPDWSMDNLPPWCGKCDELKRTTDFRSEIPRGNGATTDQCLDCNPYMMKHKKE
jgi:hypothetical protein